MHTLFFAIRDSTGIIIGICNIILLRRRTESKKWGVVSVKRENKREVIYSLSCCRVVVGIVVVFVDENDAIILMLSPHVASPQA